MKTRKMCIVRVLSGMFVAFFVASCSSDQGAALRSGETSSAEKANVVGTTVQEARDPATIAEEERSNLNRWYDPDTDYGSLTDAQASHRPGTQQSSLATLRTDLATATAMDSDGTPTDIADATGYQADGDTKENPNNDELYERGRYVYANQPSLDAVGTAFAYIRDANQPSPQALGTAFASDTLQDGRNREGFNLGAGGQISVITNNRFDPTHPSFDSSDMDASYDTLTRFFLGIEGGDINTIANVIDLFFENDSGELVQVYNTDFNSKARAYVTIPVPALDNDGNDGTNPVPFDTISRNTFSGNTDIQDALLSFIEDILGGNRVAETVTIGASLNINDDDFIELTDSDNTQNYNHIGRVYGVTSNIASYQIVAAPTGTSFQDDDNMDSSGLGVADDAAMGLLALINGRRNLDGISTFADLKIATHGIAPRASLHVFSSFKANESNFNGADLIYRARGIDVARDRERDDDGMVIANAKLIADDTRNIVLLQNTIAHADRSEAATQANVNDVVGVAGSTIDDDYKDIYDALKLGVADTNMQDIYVFAAADGRTTDNDAGLLASIAGAQEDSGDGSLTRLFAEYSLVVAAVEAAADAYCGSVVAAFCITAPGTYTYRGRGTDNTYGGGDDTLETIGTPTSNAAASLVAGGLAVLMNVFGDQITSKDLVSRVLSTAAKRFDVDGDDENDYTDTSDGSENTERYGVGMFDLECASRPLTRRASPCRAVCRDATPFENSARNDCVAMCAAGEGLSASSGANRRCIGVGVVTAQQCVNAEQVLSATAGAGCITPMTCRGDMGAINAGECVTASPQTCFADDGQGFSNGSCAEPSASSCLQNSGYILNNAMDACIALMECSGGTPFLNSALDMCEAMCASGEGVSAGSGASVRVCIASGDVTAQQCVNNGAVRLADNSGCADRCSANNAPANGQCGLATTVCATTDGYDNVNNVCVTSGQTAATCQALGMRVLQTGGSCAAMCATNNAPNAGGQCGTATTVCTGAQGYDSGTNTCIAVGDVMAAAECAVFTGTGGKNVYRATMGCVTESACQGGGVRAVNNQNECVDASEMACFEDGGQGFTSGTGCVTAASGTCSSTAGYRFDSGAGECVAIINCSGGTPIINSAQNGCTASCAAGEGLSAMSGAGRRCIAASDATGTQCVNNGAVRLAAGTGCADRCIANNAPNASGQCGVATTVCATTDGYNTGTRRCVTSGQTAATCQALAMRVLQTGGNCAAMCADNNAPNASGQCGTATSVCTGAQGYNSGTNTCVDAADVMSAAECAVFTGTGVRMCLVVREWVVSRHQPAEAVWGQSTQMNASPHQHKHALTMKDGDSRVAAVRCHRWRIVRWMMDSYSI